MRIKFAAAAVLLLLVTSVQAEDGKMKAAVDAFAKQFEGSWVSESELDSDAPGIGKKGDRLIGHLTFKKQDGLIEVSWHGENNGKPVGTRARGIIGWDVKAEKLRVRWFSSGGANGTIVYTHAGDHWSNKINVVDPDGTPFSADQRMSFPKDGSYTVKMTNRKNGDESLPDREIVWHRGKKLKKSKKSKKK